MTEKYFILDCRETGKGAHTTMGGDEFDNSRTGNHWKERLAVEIGDVIEIVDVSNSGKHNCEIVQITKTEPEIEFKVLEYGETADGICCVCGD